jgi:hypothetical protein
MMVQLHLRQEDETNKYGTSFILTERGHVSAFGFSYRLEVASRKTLHSDFKLQAPVQDPIPIPLHSSSQVETNVGN